MTPTSTRHRLFQPRILLLTGALSLSLAAFLAVPARPALAEGEQQFAALGNCKLDSGQEIEGCRLGYRTWGKLNPESTNAILFPTWFGGTSKDIAGMIGEKGLADPAKYFVIVVDSLGNGISSSPSNSKTQPRMAFPVFTTRDMVRSEYRLVTESLHLKHLHAVMGVSMGGIQAFEWMVDYPDFMDVAIPIVGTPRPSSYDLTLWQLEDDMIRSSPEWRNGEYETNPHIRLLTILGELSGSSPGHYAREVTRQAFPARYASYGHANGAEFDINNRLYQLHAILHHDVAEGGTMEDAAKRVHAKVFILPSQQDHIVNPGPALEFARLLNAKTMLLTSDCGHGAPGCEADKVNPAVRAFLDGQ